MWVLVNLPNDINCEQFTLSGSLQSMGYARALGEHSKYSPLNNCMLIMLLPSADCRYLLNRQQDYINVLLRMNNEICHIFHGHVIEPPDEILEHSLLYMYIYIYIYIYTVNVTGMCHYTI